MLKGYYTYKNFTYGLDGYDYGDNYAFYLSTPSTEARKFVDHGITIGEGEDATVFPADWDKIYVSVGSGFVKVSCYTDKEGGVIYKNKLNEDFFARLAGIIVGMVNNCNNLTRADKDERLFNSFVPKASNTYHIGEKGTVKLNMRSLQYLKYTSGDEDLELFEVPENDIRVIRDTRVQHRIKIDLSEFAKPEDTDDMDDWDFSDEDRLYTLSEIIERNPEKSYAWIKGKKYKVVTDFDEMVSICQEIWNWDGVVSFDTETTGLNFTFLCKYGIGDRLVGLVFSIREGESWYFPVAHKKIKNICTPENESYIINKYFKPILEKKKILCHNGSFDWKVMYVYDIWVNLTHDTLILPKVTIWNTNRGLPLGLKEDTQIFLGRDSFSLSDFVPGKWGKNNIKFWDLDKDSVESYACPDTDNALCLLNYYLKEGYLEKFCAKKIYQIEVAFSIVIAYQEFYGHCVNIEKVEDLRADIAKTKEDEYKAMVDIVGHDFNPRSTKDLPDVMFRELGMPIIEYTDTGNPSTGKKTRKFLMGERNPDGSLKYPFVTHLNNYLVSAQLESNFTKNIDKYATEDGFMFSEVKQFLETGRVSVKEPNYQSYNDIVKKYIIARRGYYAMDADYSSIEYRILACMAGQENLIKRFEDPDMDYHTYQASRMFRIPYELVTKAQRSNSKGINFGIPYGMGDPKLGERLFGERTPENTLKAKKMRRLYFEGQEHIEQFFIKARADGVKNMFSTTFFDRRRYFEAGKKDKGSVEREAGNNRIQGTAADIYKIAMVRLLTNIRKKGLAGKVLISAFVHDECFLEVHKSIDPAKMLKMLRESMMLEIEGWCPLYTGNGFGTNWYDAKKTEIPVQVQEYIVKTWGETGLDWWDGDAEKLFYWEVGLINDYKRDRVIDYLKNEENWNKVFSPVENGFAHEVIEELLAGRHVDGVVDKDVHTDKDMVKNLEQFCKAFGIMDLFEKANIQAPNYDEQKSDISLDDEELEEEAESQVDLNAILMQRLNTIGVGFAERNGKRCLFFRYDEKDMALMNTVHQVFSNNPGSIPLKTFINGEEYDAGMSVNSKAYTEVLQYYSYRKNHMAVR